MSALAEALAALEVVWTSADPSLADRLAPGVASHHVRAAADAFGITATDDLLDWYGWHDGVRGPPAVAVGGSSFYFITLDQAVERLRINKWVLQQLSPDEAAGLWRSSLFPLAASAGSLLMTLDCSPSIASQVVVSDPAELLPTDGPTLLGLVQRWLELHATGVYSFRDGQWQTDRALLSPHERAWGLYG